MGARYERFAKGLWRRSKSKQKRLVSFKNIRVNRMVDIEKFIKKMELEGYVKETLVEIVQLVDKKIQKDMPGVRIVIRIELGMVDSRTPRRKE